MNKGILSSLFLIGALAAPVPLTKPAVGQETPQQTRNPKQDRHQDLNKRHEQQQHQAADGDYTYEETVDRDWLKEQPNNHRMSQYRSGNADYTSEETVDRNWLKEHDLD